MSPEDRKKAAAERNRLRCAAYYRKNRAACNARSKAYEEKFKEKNRADRKAWAAANPEKTKEIRHGINVRFYEKNRAAQQQRARDYAAKNREKHRAKAIKWAADNPEKVRANKQRRKARKESQLHPGLDLSKEAVLFEVSQRLTQETGVLHHVDHIIPLDCGGWHHHDNLQVLPGPLNVSKGSNPFWEKEGYKSWRDVPEALWPEMLVPAYRARLSI